MTDEATLRSEHSVEHKLLMVIREVTDSNKRMAETMTKAVDLAHLNQNEVIRIRQVCLDIYEKLTQKDQRTELEESWKKELARTLFGKQHPN